MTFCIKGQLPNLNDYLKAERRTKRGRNGQFNTCGNIMKHDAQNYIIPQIRKYLGFTKLNVPVKLHYHFFEPNRKRDMDNIASFAMKVIQDSLVLSKVLPNDGWEWIRGFTCDFDVDEENPRIIVDIEELEC